MPGPPNNNAVVKTENAIAMMILAQKLVQIKNVCVEMNDFWYPGGFAPSGPNAYTQQDLNIDARTQHLVPQDLQNVMNAVGTILTLGLPPAITNPLHALFPKPDLKI